MTPRTVTIRVEGARAAAILEHIINPALKDHECRVDWPDQNDPEIAVTFDDDDLAEIVKAK